MRERVAMEKIDAALFRSGAENYDLAVDLLLTVVREIAAEELREAADDDAEAFPGEVAAPTYRLRARADALTKPPDGPVR